MNIRIAVCALLLVPALALAQAEKAETKAKPAAKPAAKPVATVNGVAIPQSRADFLMQQQQQRGGADNDQMRMAVREELVNRELLLQEATRGGFARNPEVLTHLDMARQEIIVTAAEAATITQSPVRLALWGVGTRAVNATLVARAGMGVVTAIGTGAAEAAAPARKGP